MNPDSPRSVPPKDSSSPGREEAVWTREDLLGVQRRDPQALGVFFERTFDSVYGLAFRMLSDRAARPSVSIPIAARFPGF